MSKLKPIVTDIYDFSTLIRNGYVYVDKTSLLHRLASGIDGRLFFMSRPRRFGKSLMISTLERIFKGERQLFKGLAIGKTEYDWFKYPIIRLDMTAFDQTSGLAHFKRALAAEFGGEDPVAAFRALVDKKAKSSRGRGVVVLIDEYDSPVSGLLGKPSELEAMREFLQSFYRILKEKSASIRFLMMTGVSKFARLSVFSGLNNLTDLTMDPVYAGLLGYTHEELVSFFKPQIAAFAHDAGSTPSEIVEGLLAWYDSYRFSPRSETRVCNPVSIGLALKSRSFEAFWNRTGSSTLIVERLCRCGKLPIDVERIKLPAKRMDVCDLHELPVESLMYQGGYLTIKSVAPDGDLILGLPNQEVREAVYGGFLDEIFKRESDNFASRARELVSLLSSKGCVDSAVCSIVSSVFAMVPHEWNLKSEAEAKRYFLLFMRMAGATINAEVESSNGRADAILETEKAVYIFEFKYGKSAKAALKQCRDRNYAAPYATSGRKILYVGVNYDVKKHSIAVEDEPVNEPVNFGHEPVNEPVISEVLSAVAEHPGARRPVLLSLVPISEASMKRALAALIASGRIEFRGAPKNGGYFCIEAK